jgi:hypothetical protein
MPRLVDGEHASTFCRPGFRAPGKLIDAGAIERQTVPPALWDDRLL